MVLHVIRMSQKRVVRLVLLTATQGKRPIDRPMTNGVTASPTLLDSVFVWSYGLELS